MAASRVTMRRLGAICVAVSAVCALTALLYALIWHTTTDQAFYRAVYAAEGVQENVGVSPDTLDVLTRDLIAYLRGDLPVLDRRVVVDGALRVAFDTRERAHMADVRALYRAGKRWALGCVAVCGVFALTSCLCAWRLDAAARRRMTGVGLLLAVGAVLTLVGALAVYASIDFDTAFTQWHRLVFSNDLWLLNPETEVLIRMMPVGLFIRACLQIGVVFSLALLVMGSVGGWLFRKGRGKNR